MGVGEQRPITTAGPPGPRSLLEIHRQAWDMVDSTGGCTYSLDMTFLFAHFVTLAATVSLTSICSCIVSVEFFPVRVHCNTPGSQAFISLSSVPLTGGRSSRHTFSVAPCP